MTGEPQLGSHKEHMKTVAASHKVLKKINVERTRRTRLKGWQLKRNSGLRGGLFFKLGLCRFTGPWQDPGVLQISIFNFSKEW